MFNGERKVSGAEARRRRQRFDRFCQSLPRPDKLYPQITFQELLYAVGVVTTRREPQSGRISALAGREGRLRACTPELKATSPTATTKHSYNIHHFKAMHYPGRWPGWGAAFQ